MKKDICEICGSTDNFNIEITKKYHGSNNLNNCKNNTLDIHSYHFSKNLFYNFLKMVRVKIHSVNRYVDNNYLCVTEKKSKEFFFLDLDIDNSEKVIGFCDRWQAETEWLKKIN